MLKNIFTNIYTRNYWRSKETPSGGGSEILRTKAIRSQLVDMLRSLRVRSMLDAGCGDWNWMGRIDFGEIEVTGCDIVEAVVAQNRKKYGKRFFVADITTDPLPMTDLILCRLVLNHLSFANIEKALKNFSASGAAYMLITHYPNETQNIEKKDGDWRPLNFCLPPFNLIEPLDTIAEENSYLTLWRTI